MKKQQESAGGIDLVAGYELLNLNCLFISYSKVTFLLLIMLTDIIRETMQIRVSSAEASYWAFRKRLQLTILVVMIRTSIESVNKVFMFFGLFD